MVADEPTRLQCLSRESFLRLQRLEPEVGSAFHSLMVRILADRLGFANREIAALQR